MAECNFNDCSKNCIITQRFKNLLIHYMQCLGYVYLKLIQHKCNDIFVE